MKKSQMVRIVEFDRQVTQGKYPNSLCFSVDYEVSQRTVLRDIEYLRDQLGAPLQYDAQHRGFIYTHDWDLPHIIPMSASCEDASTQVITLFRSLNVEDRLYVLRELKEAVGAESASTENVSAAA
jgi:hypothetical protein